MKKTVLTCFCIAISFYSFAQSVTLEPGKSIFDQNTTESVEIKSTSAFPLTLRSTQPASGLPFYSNTNIFRGHIQGGVGGMIYSTPANHGHSFWTKNQPRMTIDSIGNVGIGVVTPKYKLHLVGDLTSFPDTLVYFGNSNSSPLASENYRIVLGEGGFLFNSFGFFGRFLGLNASSNLRLNFNSDFTINNSSQTVLRIDNTNNVTINPNSTVLSYISAKADLDVNNTIRSAELDFSEALATERRLVFADKDGILRVEGSSDHYISYNFSSVLPQNSSDDYTKGSGYAWFNTTSGQKTFYLPVNLPDGVKITNVRMYLIDNSASNLSFTFNRNSHLGNTFTTIASAQSSTSTANLFSINSSANEIVDNQNNSYYVNISSSGNWTGNTLQFHSLVITYQYQ
jgi:hypothetical protein